MTEEEHKKMWCPQTQIIVRADGGLQASGFTGDQSCIGSACAWWRWIPVSPVRWEGDKMIMQYPDPKPTEGYCGPAGKP